VLILKVRLNEKGAVKAWIHHSGQQPSLDGDKGIACYKDQLVGLATELVQTREPVILTLKTSKTSQKPYVDDIQRVPMPESFTAAHTEPVADPGGHGEPVDLKDLPF
jgi:hypothetical protein